MTRIKPDRKTGTGAYVLRRGYDVDNRPWLKGREGQPPHFQGETSGPVDEELKRQYANLQERDRSIKNQTYSKEFSRLITDVPRSGVAIISETPDDFKPVKFWRQYDRR